jgi:hypothetical protein
MSIRKKKEHFIKENSCQFAFIRARNFLIFFLSISITKQQQNKHRNRTSSFVNDHTLVLVVVVVLVVD